MAPCVFPRLFFPRAHTTASEDETLSLPLVCWSLGPGSAGGKGSRVLGLAGQGQVGGGEEKGLRHRAHGPLSLDAAAVLAQEPWQPWMLPVEAEALGSGRSCESWHLGCSGPLC